MYTLSQLMDNHEQRGTHRHIAKLNLLPSRVAQPVVTLRYPRLWHFRGERQALDYIGIVSDRPARVRGAAH